ncbi:IS1380 family transposase [Thomasclavelia cocleata]|uniref:IS1380 family transposase n=1 Tax=Thomasclavelia cocleata TaxID=69824 RepID=UPI002431744A|nr:IS1380 family transposase [Thomasclavelia cocleata]
MNYKLPFCNINFNGGNLSSDGGAILLLSFLNKFSHFDFIKNLSFHDLRKNPEFSNTSIFKQLIIRNILGYFNQDHQKVLLQDPLLSHYTEACSQPTVSRFYDRLTNQVNMDFKSHLVKLACDYINQNIDEPILDVDSTKTETAGKQEGAAKIHHYNTTGYHPMIINEFHSKLLVGGKLRTGKAYSSNGFIQEMDELLAHLNTKNKKIRLRGDSAFYNKDYMAYLEEKNIIYYFRVKGFASVKNAVFDDTCDKNIDFQAYTEDHPYMDEIQYTISQSNQARRVVYKIYGSMDKKQQELLPTIYCVMTNDDSLSAKEVMKFYEERGN